jgi:serine/threonine-protein kinase RsbW/stage II sporulation protein AB (anti-sigma F factor)
LKPAGGGDRQNVSYQRPLNQTVPTTTADIRALPDWDMPDLELAVTARAENVAVVRHAIESLVDETSMDEERRADVILAVGEACANAVIHGYNGMSPGTLELRARTHGRSLEVIVSDYGRGMAPRPDSPGLGLGLPLMASLSRSLELRPGRRGGTEVWMTFDLPADGNGRGPRFARTG